MSVIVIVDARLQRDGKVGALTVATTCAETLAALTFPLRKAVVRSNVQAAVKEDEKGATVFEDRAAHERKTPRGERARAILRRLPGPVQLTRNTVQL